MTCTTFGSRAKVNERVFVPSYSLVRFLIVAYQKKTLNDFTAVGVFKLEQSNALEIEIVVSVKDPPVRSAPYYSVYISMTSAIYSTGPLLVNCWRDFRSVQLLRKSKGSWLKQEAQDHDDTTYIEGYLTLPGTIGCRNYIKSRTELYVAKAPISYSGISPVGILNSRKLIIPFRVQLP